MSQYPPDERWPRISRWIDRELKSEEVQFDQSSLDDLKSRVADRLFFTCLRNANSWRRRGMQAHGLTGEYWGFVKSHLESQFVSAVKSIKNGQGRGELQTEDESNSLSNVESVPASQESSAILTTDEIEVLINKAAPTKSSGSRKRPSGKKGKRTGRKSPADNLRLTKDEWRVIQQLRKSADRQANAKKLGMELAKYDQHRTKAIQKLKELARRNGRRQD